MDEPSATTRVTLRDIARRLNVTHTTISRALRDDPQVSTALRQKIQQTAQAMGYRPDPMLAALAHYRRAGVKSQICAELGWINPWPEAKELRSFREFDLYWKGAFNEAERWGFRLEEFHLNAEMTPSRLHQILRARNIQGLLLPPKARDLMPNWAGFPWEEFCVVRFGHSIKYPAAHLVASDQMSDGLIAFEKMRAHGYHRVGLITGASSSKSIVRFAAGYLFGGLGLPKADRLPPLMLSQANASQDQQKLVTWFKRTQPDAILTDVASVGDMLKRAGFRVPRDVALAAMSVLDGNADAGIDQNSGEIGRAAVQLLISLINHNERGIPKVCREVLIEGSWVDGKSLPPKIIKDAPVSIN
ncbi:MAG: LacI family DNA-binding transcriptional regulator [Akkermansiaceae bacterium]|nr:LacI family DNA-binding transcriptional regulator [Verrucomicrobiales bacterium]